MAKVIFNGGDLEFAPGGGICQASTTVYRAIVNAGFPVMERRAHSLYVSYYKKHGVGIDATIYPGSQDLVFLNDSDSPLIIQAYNDGTDATVNIYGSPDGRSVELNGPYFASTAPDGYLYKGRRIMETEIVWSQQVTYPDGSKKDYQIGSRYKTLPKSVAVEFETEQNVFTAAPPEPLASARN
ncbi:MAG: VanW family protein, partial [Candidatus Peribacteraceae bacterium]|nr:VanW family protein [Candidatus Peribacteraceae bacterium]